MYQITVTTPPAGVPVTAAELREHLRLNDAAQDALLTEFLAAAVDQFEQVTRRPVLTTAYRQHFAYWANPIVLGRAGVTVVSAVTRVLLSGTEPVASWVADLGTPPARVTLTGDRPPHLFHPNGLAVSPAGYVDFAAGWPDAAAVPRGVRVAVKLLAGHYARHREAFTDGRLAELPAGWESLVAPYKLGVQGGWGQ